MTEGYRGGYAFFYEAVKELAARGAFDASEVTDSDLVLPSTGAAVDEFINLYPKRGVFKGCIATKLEGQIYSVYHESDRGQFVEKFYFTNLELPEQFVVALDMELFTYEKSHTASLFAPKEKGRFRRPDLRDQEERREAKRELARERRDNNNLDRREIQHPKAKVFKPFRVSVNLDKKPRGRAELPKVCEAGGLGGLGNIRHRDDWDSNLRQQGFQDSDDRLRSRDESDQFGCARLIQGRTIRVSKKFKKSSSRT